MRSGMRHGKGVMPTPGASSPQPVSPLYAWALWCGGLDEAKNIYTTAETYRQFGASDNAVGPITSSGKAISDSSRAAYWDKVYKVSDWQINHHSQGKSIDAINNWPGNGASAYDEPAKVAAYDDLNNNGTYEPAKGELPAMLGNQMLYSVNNDAAFKSETGAASMPLEVHTYTYGYNCKKGILENTFFVDYYLINKSKSDFDSFYVGMWSDIDLGAYFDDAMGSVPNKAFFSYNYSDSDALYLDSMPMISVYPVNKDLSKFMYYANNFSVTGNPRNGTAKDYYGYLKGNWKDGSCLQEGGNGYTPNSQSSCTDFMFNGNPFDTTSWSMVNEVRYGLDIRGLGSVYFGDFKAGDTLKITWAFSAHWKHHRNREKQYFSMIDNIDYIKGLYKNGGFETLCKTPLSIQKTEATDNIAVYPNPSKRLFTIEAPEKATYEVYDSNGKLVQTIVANGRTRFSLTHSGIYLLRNSSSGAQKRLVVY